jgi:hypothetical protein
MELYEMLISNELVDGVFRIGLVESPAIEEDFILLSKENDKIDLEIKLAKPDKKRKVVCGAVLIPDKIIPREEYNIIFSKETIRKISENYLIQNNKDNVSFNHAAPINEVYMIESWIVEDVEQDKSKFLGFDVPAGTWMASYKINNEDLWKQAIETGALKGFSIEGHFTHQKVEQLKQEEPIEDPIDKDIKHIIRLATYQRGDLGRLFKWVASKGDKANCPACQELDGQIHTLDEWLRIAIPGVPDGEPILNKKTRYKYSPYATFCEDRCNCRLIPV